jgi:hypothetical protein
MNLEDDKLVGEREISELEKIAEQMQVGDKLEEIRD